MPGARRWISRLLVGCTAMFGMANASMAAEAKIAVTAPWTLATPETAKVAGGFVTLTNTGKQSDRLIRAETEVSRSVEIHEMHVVKGVMMMRQHNAGITLKPGAKMTLKPFSHHLMLMDLKRQLKPGETVKGTLVFEKSGAIDVVFTVEPPGSNRPTAGRGGRIAPSRPSN